MIFCSPLRPQAVILVASPRRVFRAGLGPPGLFICGRRQSETRCVSGCIISGTGLRACRVARRAPAHIWVGLDGGASADARASHCYAHLIVHVRRGLLLYAHLADSLARLHFVAPNELGSAALHLVADSLSEAHVADSFARLRCAPPDELGSRSFCLVRAKNAGIHRTALPILEWP
jgi:hypothetical protein